MKKVLAAGAALMLAGSMVSAAYAEVNLSGDARVRYVGKSDYATLYTVNSDGSINTSTNGYSDYFDSRVRVKFNAKAKGGAFMKARVRFDDYKWDGQGWGASSEAKNVWADYAFIGIPMGPVTISGGRMPANFSKFFSFDGRPSRLKADYKNGGVRIIGVIDTKDEFTDNALDEWDDNDFMGYGLVMSFKIGDAMTLKTNFRYHDDARAWNAVTTDVSLQQTDNVEGGSGGIYTLSDVPTGELVPSKDRSGYLGSIHLNGKAGIVGYEAEFAMKEAPVQGSKDDAMGAYAQVSMDLGAFTPAFMVGQTWDGYMADDDFGFIMVGAAEPITYLPKIGISNGDAFWAAFMANFKVSDQFKLAANVVWFSFDSEATDRLADALEVSGSATYVISEGADLTYKLGYLSPSIDGRANAAGISDESVFGQYLRMAIKF